ncbi:hypothetical protein ACOMHN_046272 [Nucella lapillus]
MVSPVALPVTPHSGEGNYLEIVSSTGIVKLSGPRTHQTWSMFCVRSMREIRENLRQAALLNIVAAANNEGVAPYHPHPHPHHPEGPPPTPELLSSLPLLAQMTTNGTSLFQHSMDGGGAAAGSRSAGSGTHHSTKRDSGDTSPLPQNLVANLLSPRMRTISIPRPGPRISDLSGPFIHKSLTQAKECLSKVGEMVRARTEGAMLTDSGKASVTNELVPYVERSHTSVAETLEESPPPQRPPPALVQILDGSGSPVNGGDSLRSTSAFPNKAGTGSTASSITSNALPLHSASSSHTIHDGPSVGSRKPSARSREDQSGSAHRALSVRRHLSPGKKRELVKRLTEMAKCEAVDMSNPMSVQLEQRSENRFRPPMIILSQQRQEIRFPEDPLSTAPVQFSARDVDSGGDMAQEGGGMYRARSLTSLHHAHSYVAAASGESLASHLEGPDTDRSGRLHRAASGSMPDLVMEGGPPSSAIHQRDMKRSDSSDWTAGSQTFAEGIVGKTLLKDKEVSNTRGLVESRPFLPSTPKYRFRRATRPSSRRSMLGLRDRGPPQDTPTGSTPATTTSTSVFSLSLSGQNRLRSTPGGAPSSEPPPPSAQNLPVLTITGLNRERPPPGTPSANSREARELRPTSRAEVAGILQLYQQLDDQCEKLQRQLNISLNMPPKKVAHWQSGTVASPSIPMSHTGFSTHHLHHPSSLFLTDGHGEDANHSGNTTHFRGYDLNTRPADPAAMAPLSDVEEQSHVAGSVTQRPDPHHLMGGASGLFQNGFSERWGQGQQNVGEASARYRKAGSSGLSSDATDPVLQSKKEPRYQGFSSRVPESEARSQFHYITPGSVAESEAEEERERKYRVLKALDQDVYYDFQHRKYRNTPGSTPVDRCNNEEDRPRVHFYKVKLNGET